MRMLILSLRDLGKAAWSVIGFYLQLTVAGLFVSFAATLLNWDLVQIRLLHAAREMVSFTSYYRTDNRHMATPAALQQLLLRETDATGRAASYALSASLDGIPPNQAEVYLLVGDARTLLLDEELGSVGNTGFAHIGANVSAVEVGDLVSLGDVATLQIPVAGRIPAGAKLLHRSMNFSLDDCVLVHLSYQQILDAFGGYFDIELIPNLVFHQDDRETIAAYVDAVNHSGFMQVIPHSNWQYLLTPRLDNFRSTAYFVLFFLLFLAFSLMAVLLFLLDLVRRNMREYAIHQMAGSTLTHQLIRLALLLFWILAPPPLLVACILRFTFFATFLPGVKVYVGLIGVAYVLSLVFLTVKTKQGLALQLRSDDIV